MAQISDAAAPEPAEVIAGYRSWLAAHCSFRAIGNESSIVNSSVVPPNFEYLRRSESLATDGTTRSRFVGVTTYKWLGKNNEIKTKTEKNDNYYDATRSSHFSVSGPKGIDKSVILTLGDKGSGTNDLMRQCMGDAYFFGKLLYTYPASSYSQPSLKLDEVLNVSAVTASRPVANDSRIIRLEGESKWGIVTADFDLSRGYQPVRFQQRRNSQHAINGDKTLAEFRMGKFYIPKQACANLNYTAEFTQPAADAVDAVVTIEFVFADGKTATIREETNLKSVVYNPDHAALKSFDWKPDVPNGSPVTVTDHPEDTYEWLDGAAVRSAGPEPEQLPATTSNTHLIVALAGTVVAVAGACLVWRRANRVRAEA